MTKELHFRAWDDKKKMWVGSVYLSLDGKLISQIVETENIVIEQYTGLDDKYGKEIYEGDIIEVETATFEETEVSRYEVYWNEDMLDDSLRLIRGIDYDDCVAELSTSAVRVIGNIHENTELLKGR